MYSIEVLRYAIPCYPNDFKINLEITFSGFTDDVGQVFRAETTAGIPISQIVKMYQTREGQCLMTSNAD